MTPMLIRSLLLFVALCLLALLLFSDDPVRFFHAQYECVPMNSLDFIDRRTIQNDSIPARVRGSRSVYCRDLRWMISRLAQTPPPNRAHRL